MDGMETSSANPLAVGAIDVVEAWTAALNRHDADAAASCMALDVVFTDLGTDQRCEGRDAYRRMAVGFLSMFSDLAVEKSSTLCDGLDYAVEWIMTGRRTGSIPDLPATGKPFRIQGAGLGRVDDGLIVRATEYWNMADFLRQVGVLPA